MSNMVEVGRDTVSPWECDAMGHMNVRFFSQRSVDAVHSLGLYLGFGPRRMDTMQLTWSLREHHIRFLSELRPGAPCVLRSGVLSVGESRLRLYQELSNPQEDDQIVATFQLEVELTKEPGFSAEPIPGEMRARANNLLVELPEYAAPRGVVLDSPRPAPSPEEAEELSLPETYRGIVGKADTDLMCRMLPWSFMARISDGLPHFFRKVGDVALDMSKGQGSAALEYRLLYRATPILGDVIVIRSGLKEQRDKTTHFCHWIFHEETGECVCTAEAVAVLFDTTTRRAVAPDSDTLARLREQVVASLTV